MKREEHIKTVLKCSKCGAEITGVRYYENWDVTSLSYRACAAYECHTCGHNDGELTVVKEYVTEVIERPYTNEELEEMIKVLQIRCANLERYLFDKAGLKEDV